MQLPIDSQLRGRTGRNMKIARPLFDHGLQELVHIRHRFIVPGLSEGYERLSAVEIR